MSLRDNIHQLVNEHMTRADDGSFVLALPLLVQLRAACKSTHGNHSGGGGQGVGLAINSAAIAIETRIREDSLAEQFERTGTEYHGSIITLLRTWADIQGEWEPYLEGVTQEWIEAIKETLIQRRPPWRPTLNCPACNQRFHGPEREPNLWVDYWNHEEESMNHPSLWTAGCDGCGATWNGDELAWLRAATDTPQPEVASRS